MSEKGKKFDDNKPRMDLLDSCFLIAVAQVLTFGAEKYGDHNWRGGLKYSRLAAATLRHFFAWLAGNDLDKESGLSHLAHAACCIMMLFWMTKNRKNLDDRYCRSKAAPNALFCPKCGNKAKNVLVNGVCYKCYLKSSAKIIKKDA